MSFDSEILVPSSFLQTISKGNSTDKATISFKESPFLLHKIRNNIITLHSKTLFLKKISNFEEDKVFSNIEENVSLSTDCIPINDVVDCNNFEDINKICPICGDNISGFHYGIFSCESCKGFFKRTVQNKKIYHCREDGSCEINVAFRKRCPACRFAKCRKLGMKIEAIRLDRTRGGRTSYGGQQSIENILHKRKRSINSSRVSELESLVSADYLQDEDLIFCENKSCSCETNVIQMMIHSADHCLYQIVRWAQSQPEFALIETEGQISLLRNSWLEMLLLNVCWKSMHLDGCIKLTANKFLSITEAKINGVEIVFKDIINLTDFFKDLEVDAYELAALKIILLLSPDVSSLKNLNEVQLVQEKYLEALSRYISTKIHKIDNKYIRLLAKLPEFFKVSLEIKKFLELSYINCYVPNKSLIFELLKEDAATF